MQKILGKNDARHYKQKLVVACFSEVFCCKIASNPITVPTSYGVSELKYD